MGISLIFALILGLTFGSGGAAVDFTTAWLLEKSLSVDNLFVFALIFGYFKVPRRISSAIPEVPSLLSLRVIVLALTAAIVAGIKHPKPAVEAESDQPESIAGKSVESADTADR